MKYPKKKSAKAELIEALKNTLYPFLEARGFRLYRDKDWFGSKDFIFLRDRLDQSDLLDLNFETHGSAMFYLSLRTGPSLVIKNLYRKFKTAEEHRCIVKNMRGALLYSSRFRFYLSGWFRPKKLLHGKQAYEKTAQRVIELFPECEAFFEGRILGPHMQSNNPTPAKVDDATLNEALKKIRP
jgi:hypothetical protein